MKTSAIEHTEIVSPRNPQQPIELATCFVEPRLTENAVRRLKRERL